MHQEEKNMIYDFICMTPLNQGVKWEPGRMQTSMLWDEHVLVIAEHFRHLEAVQSDQGSLSNASTTDTHHEEYHQNIYW